jgi:chromosome segregation ATPase
MLKRFCLLTVLLFPPISVIAQRQVSITFKDKDPIKGYLLNCDKDTCAIQDESGQLKYVKLDEVTTIFVVQKEAKTTPDNVDPAETAQREQIRSLNEQIANLNEKLKSIEADPNELSNQERISRVEGQAESYRSTIRDIQEKEANLKARIEQIGYDLDPNALEGSALIYPKREKGEYIRKRRASLQSELQRVGDLLALLSAARTRAESELLAVEAELDKLRKSDTTANPAPNNSTTSQPTSSSGTVNVRGYYRKDGTYVQPHTRSAPSRGRH